MMFKTRYNIESLHLLFYLSCHVESLDSIEMTIVTLILTLIVILYMKSHFVLIKIIKYILWKEIILLYKINYQELYLKKYNKIFFLNDEK